MVLHALHLCSGYGGFELALRLAGINTRTVAHVERDAYAAATLVARMEEAHLDRAPIWSDLTTFDGAAWRGRVDLITAGFPCQPFSQAGQQRGVDDERWLWPAIGRLISDVGPRLVFLENVPGLVRGGLPHVLSDLAVLGFDAEWGLLAASEVGAPHERERVWVMAHANDWRLEAVTELSGGPGPRVDWDADRCHSAVVGHVPDPTSTRHEGGGWDCGGASAELAGSGGDGRSVGPRAWPPGRNDFDGWHDYIAAGGPEPAVRRSTDGRPPWLADALHLGGNGLVPAVAAAAFLELARRLDIDPEEL